MHGMQDACESVAAAPYEDRFNAIMESIPIKGLGGEPLGAGSLPSNTPGAIASGLPLGDAGAAPGADAPGAATESGGVTGRDFFPGSVASASVACMQLPHYTL
jgi:hypothetical protein